MDFERSIEQGFALDNRQTFAEYAAYVLDLKQRTGTKATPPRTTKKDPNYFQPETISAILEALESEPLKWRLITHLLIVTGCRRGEIMGLKWEKIDFENSRVKIDRALVRQRPQIVLRMSSFEKRLEGDPKSVVF